jgi:hypothetical protein
MILDVKMTRPGRDPAVERIAAHQIAPVVILTAFSQREDPSGASEARHRPRRWLPNIEKASGQGEPILVCPLSTVNLAALSDLGIPDREKVTLWSHL